MVGLISQPVLFMRKMDELNVMFKMMVLVYISLGLTVGLKSNIACDVSAGARRAVIRHHASCPRNTWSSSEV